MIECTVDTHILAEILMQYNPARAELPLVSTESMGPSISKKLNICIESAGFEGVIIASAFAFVEIVNQFKKVSKEKFNMARCIGMLNQPPDWFIVEPFDATTIFHLISVPKFNLKQINIELADAIHVATAMQRGPKTVLVTNDGVLNNLNFDNLNIEVLNSLND